MITVIRMVPAGVLFGLLAYVGDDAGLGDHLGFHQEQLLVAATGSVLVWGLAAFLTGHAVPDRRRAAVAATVLLVSATAGYYLLIVLVSRRWSRGTLEDGSSADLSGLLDIAFMTAVWLAVSVTAGPVLGLLGHTARTARLRPAATAAAVTCGLLASEAVHRLVTIRAWQMPAEIFGVVLPLLVLTALTVRHRWWPAGRILPLTFTAALAVGAVSWWAVSDLSGRLREMM